MIAKITPNPKPHKHPNNESKKVTPIAFNKNIMFHIEKNEGISWINLSIYWIILILTLKQYLPVIASSNVAIYVIIIYTNAVIEKISTDLNVSEFIMKALPVNSSTPNIAAIEVPRVIKM